MRFMDPCPVTCPTCGAASEQPVADLLGLRASCPACDGSLAAIGSRMRETVDEMAAFCTWANILMQVESKLGASIDDAEMFTEDRHPHQITRLTLRDLARLVARYLPQTPDADGRAVRLVLEAVGLAPAGTDEGVLDRPLVDSLDPKRWEGR
jgi:hypothetical protein